MLCASNLGTMFESIRLQPARLAHFVNVATNTKELHTLSQLSNAQNNTETIQFLLGQLIISSHKINCRMPHDEMLRDTPQVTNFRLAPLIKNQNKSERPESLRKGYSNCLCLLISAKLTLVTN